MRRLLSIGVLTLLASHFCAPAFGQTSAKPNPFENEIKAYEAADKTHPPPKSPILFVGSSSIRLWTNVATVFPGRAVINRGFGGSQMSDLLHFADRIVLPYSPARIFIYEGDNDLASGKSPEQLLKDASAVAAKIRQALPETVIYFIAVKPSLSRWHLAPKAREANKLLRDFANQEPLVKFIDVFTPMLGADGQPDPGLFGPDKLHMNATGYELWRKLLLHYVLNKKGESTN